MLNYEFIFFIRNKRRNAKIRLQLIFLLFILSTILRVRQLNAIDRNRPFPSCTKPLFHGKPKCKAIDVIMHFYPHAHKTHFHKKSFALSQELLT